VCARVYMQVAHGRETLHVQVWPKVSQKYQKSLSLFLTISPAGVGVTNVPGSCVGGWRVGVMVGVWRVVVGGLPDPWMTPMCPVTFRLCGSPHSGTLQQVGSCISGTHLHVLGTFGKLAHLK
jgi:hypothetical protein